MFETHPFLDCPACNAPSAFGVLSIGGNRLSQRCQKCKFIGQTILPRLNKRVIYLDQFAISNVYKIRSGESLRPVHVHNFWVEFERRIQRAKTSHAAIFPSSDIHMDETIVSRFSSELRVEHEIFGGGASFVDSGTLNRAQEMEFAKAFMSGQPAPDLQFDVDTALRGHRNDWLPNLHITVNSDYSSFASALRESRDRLQAAMLPLFERWQRDRPSFGAVLKEELAAIGKARIESYFLMWRDYIYAIECQDSDKIFNIELSSGMRHATIMAQVFKDLGVQDDECLKKLVEFWSWPELIKLPFHRIGAHMYAAIATRLAAGQKRMPSPGLSNDIKAVSTYAPYVDAMFIDIECENLLNDGRLKKKLMYRSRIFSKSSSREFFAYLQDLENELSADVKQWTSFLYGRRQS
jgi:hypothetical protein